MSSTGIVNGGVLSVNADNHKYDIAAGCGIIVDNHTDSTAPVFVFVSWNNMEELETPYLNTAQRTEVMIDSTGSVVMKESVALEDFRDYIYLGRLVHNELTVISLALNFPNAIYNVNLGLCDLASALGPINMSGNIFSANGANLFLDKTAGVIYRMGSNYTNSKKLPNEFVSDVMSSVQFRYRYRNGSGGFTTTALTNSVNPSLYDDGTGILKDPGNNNFTIQRIFLYAGSNSIYITYGQTVYGSLEDAKLGIEQENPVIDPVTANEACLRAYMVVKKGVTALNNPLNTYFKAGGKLGEPVAGGSAGGDVVGPAVSVTNSLARFSDTTGNLIKDNVGILDDSGNMSGISTITTTGNVIVGGIIVGGVPVTTVTSGTTSVGASHGVILCDASSGEITLDLPTAVDISGKIYNIKKVDSSLNRIVVNPSGSQKIDERSSQEIYSQYVCMTIVSDGSNWHII